MKKQLLVVSLPENRRLDFIKLYAMNVHVHWAPDLTEAGRALLRQGFDAIMVDFATEHDNAVTFCVSVKKRYPSVKIVFFRAFAAKGDLPADFCADVVFSHDVNEEEIVRQLSPIMGRLA